MITVNGFRGLIIRLSEKGACNLCDFPMKQEEHKCIFALTLQLQDQSPLQLVFFLAHVLRKTKRKEKNLAQRYKEP